MAVSGGGLLLGGLMAGLGVIGASSDCDGTDSSCDGGAGMRTGAVTVVAVSAVGLILGVLMYGLDSPPASPNTTEDPTLAEMYTDQAWHAAQRGDCALVRVLDPEVRAASPDYYVHTFAQYREIRLCLVQTAPPRSAGVAQ